MVTTAPAAATSERIDWRRLWWVGLLAIVASVVANSIVRLIGVALVAPSSEFLPLGFGPPIFFTVVGVLGATVVFAIVARFSRRPIRLYRIIALLALLVSIVPDLLMLRQPPLFPGTTAGAVAVLIVMHIVAYAITVWMLTTMTLKTPEMRSSRSNMMEQL